MMLERSAASGAAGCSGDRHAWCCSAAAAALLCAATGLALARGRHEVPEPEQRDRGSWCRGRTRITSSSRLERLGDDLDALLLLGLERVVLEVGGEVGVDQLVGEARAGVEAGQELPVARRTCRSPRAARAWPSRAARRRSACRRAARAAPLADHLARLAHQPDPLAVEGQHHRRARVLDHLALHHLAVVVAEPLDRARCRCGPSRSPRCRLARSSLRPPVSWFVRSASRQLGAAGEPARKKSRSSSTERPIVVAGRPAGQIGARAARRRRPRPRRAPPAARAASQAPAASARTAGPGPPRRTGRSSRSSTVRV